LILVGGLSGLIASIEAIQNGAKRVFSVNESKTRKSGCGAFGVGIFRTYIKGEDDFDAIRKELTIVNHDIIDQECNDPLIKKIH
jgi:hypothetical protein